jgi:hypothetical protein
MQRLMGVLLDVDGTLVDSNQNFNYWCRNSATGQDSPHHRSATVVHGRPRSADDKSWSTLRADVLQRALGPTRDDFRLRCALCGRTNN